MNPMTIKQQYQQALSLHQAGELEKAQVLYETILQITVDFHPALHYLGVIYHQKGQSKKAVDLILAALKNDPSNTHYLNNLALCYKSLGDFDAAVNALKTALEADPHDADLSFNLANTYFEQGIFKLAAEGYKALLAKYPGDPDLTEALAHSLNQLGHEAHLEGNYQAALNLYERLIKLMPQEAAYHYNLGNAQRELGYTQQAKASYEKALTLAPNDADIYNNLGNTQRELGLLEDAIASYQTALSINPKLEHAKVHLIHQKQHACDWDGLDELIQDIRQSVNNQTTAQISPFAFLSMPSTTAQEQRQCADLWVRNRYASVFDKGHQIAFNHNWSHERLRVAYLSADFRQHPLASLITEVLECHDRNHFEIFAYSYGPHDNSLERRRFEQAVDHFREIRTLSIHEAAQRIHQDEIDLLVDLTGFTQGSRTSIVALRPAKFSISWLGYPGTMGSFNTKPLFDYLITDEVITPPSTVDCYAEKLLYLKPCYQPNDSKRSIGNIQTKEAWGLPQDAFVFVSFNQTFKISPATFETWMTILKAVPQSVLWLLDCNVLAKKNLIHAAKECLVDPNRLIFAPRVPLDAHLARQTWADLCLDTLPYNAHTTASDALWCGVPVLTLEGDTFAGRVASSLLHALGLENFVTTSQADYIEKAIDWAQHPERLAEVKQHLRTGRLTLPLFDTKTVTRHLESLYQSVLTSS
jgi:protein O-GlcNAc transferase